MRALEILLLGTLLAPAWAYAQVPEYGMTAMATDSASAPRHVRPYFAWNVDGISKPWSVERVKRALGTIDPGDVLILQMSNPILPGGGYATSFAATINAYQAAGIDTARICALFRADLAPRQRLTDYASAGLGGAATGADGNDGSNDCYCGPANVGDPPNDCGQPGNVCESGPGGDVAGWSDDYYMRQPTAKWRQFLTEWWGDPDILDPFQGNGAHSWIYGMDESAYLALMNETDVLVPYGKTLSAGTVGASDATMQIENFLIDLTNASARAYMAKYYVEILIDMGITGTEAGCLAFSYKPGAYINMGDSWHPYQEAYYYEEDDDLWFFQASDVGGSVKPISDTPYEVGEYEAGILAFMQAVDAELDSRGMSGVKLLTTDGGVQGPTFASGLQDFFVNDRYLGHISYIDDDGRTSGIPTW